jgi:hypothetical protein
MSTFRSLPPHLRAELIRLAPGLRIRVPKRTHIPEVEILAAVLVEVDTYGRTRWSACVRVARRIRLHPRTVARIVERRAIRPPRMDPEFGGR